MAEARLEGHVYLDGHKISGSINALDLSIGCDVIDRTTIDNDTRQAMPGTKTLSASFSGFYDYSAATAVGALIRARAGSTTDSVVGITHPATQAEGDPAWQFLGGVDGTPLLGGTVTGVASLSATFHRRPGLGDARARIERFGDATTSQSSTGSQIGALGATDVAVWSVHVWNFVGTSLDLILESDDNAGFTSAATRDSATRITAANSKELRTYATAQTDDYWRISSTFVGTSYSYVVLLGGWGTQAGG